MPQGVLVDVADGTATIEFLDPRKRGYWLGKLIEVSGGSKVIDPDTRSGSSKLYRVPVDNARAAGLLDDATEAVRRPDKSSGGNVAGAVLPEVFTSGNAHGQAVRTGAYRGEQYETVLGGGGDASGQPVNVDPFNSSPGVVDPITSAPIDGGVPGAPQAVEAVTSVPGEAAPEDVERPQGSPPIPNESSGIDPFNEPLPPANHPEVGNPVSEYSQAFTGEITEVTEITAQGDPVDAAVPAEPVTETPAAPAAPEQRYPGGKPSARWRRPELDAYALDHKGVDTTDEDAYPSKDAVLAVINGE